jgi:hypothetical protein
MSSFTLARPSVVINNTSVLVVPNSVSYTSGLGEQNVRTQSAGGGATDLVISQNVETNMSSFKMSMFPTPENIAVARAIKSNAGLNVIDIVDNEATPPFTKTIQTATLINDYEVNLGADTTIDLEFMGSTAV